MNNNSCALTLLSNLILLSCLSSNPAKAQGNLENCVLIKDNKQRLTCFDQAMTSRKLNDSRALSPVVTTTTEDLPKPSRDISTLISEDDFGLEHKIDISAENSQRTFIVASSRHNDFTGWTIEFENSQVWKQVGTDSYRIRQGQRYTLRRGSLNSFFLGNLNDSRTIRITRIK